MSAPTSAQVADDKSLLAQSAVDELPAWPWCSAPTCRWSAPSRGAAGYRLYA